MSNVYIQEPPTTGKVLLVTSMGDIDIELWCKETPLACRNFIQLCLEGYYNQTIFHRIVKGFCIQGGDPTGTGSGGESIYGATFKDEFHQRLKFNRRGLVAMANGGPHDNGSQFFITLDKTDELNKKHTLFGKVTGTTIFNVTAMGELPIDAKERPDDPPRILRVDVLNPYFDDIIPREIAKPMAGEEAVKKRERAVKAVKNFKLMSFGEDEEDADEKEVFVPKIKVATTS